MLFLKGMVIGSGIVLAIWFTFAVLSLIFPTLGIENHQWIMVASLFIGVILIRQKYNLPVAWLLVAVLTGGMIIPIMLGAAFTQETK